MEMKFIVIPGCDSLFALLLFVPQSRTVTEHRRQFDISQRTSATSLRCYIHNIFSL